MFAKFTKQCFKCAHYVVVEERVGYCKLFDNFKHARENVKLCGPEGKWFKDMKTPKKHTSDT